MYVNNTKFEFPKHLVTYILSFLNENFDKHYKERIKGQSVCRTNNKD